MTTRPIICLGSAFWDTVFQVDSFPTAGIKVLPSRAIQLASGMATSAAITIARLGGNAHLWSRLGSDETAERFLLQLKQEGVNVDHVRRFADVATPFASTIVDQAGERIVIPYIDPRLSKDPSWLPLADVARAAAVLVDVRWVDGAVALLDAARSAGIPAVLDADTASIEDLQRLVPAATHVLFSEAALRIYAEPSSPDAALLDVARRGDAAMVGVTLGAEGSMVWTRDSARVEHIAAPAIVPVDTLNAGDIWHGTFVWGLCKQWPMTKIAKIANVAAAMKCEVFGGRLGAPSLDELRVRAHALGVDL
jgi:sulfofructose kinase